MERIINIIINQVIRRLVNTGINKGLSQFSKVKNNTGPDQSAASQATAKRARDAARLTRRLGR